MNGKIILNKEVISKKAEGNNVVITNRVTMPRYTLQKEQGDYEMELIDLKNVCFFNLRGKFSHCNNTKLEKMNSFEEDAKAFLDYCKKNNLTPYVVNVYEHSGCVFSFSDFPEDIKSYNTRHGWDSFCCGFVGIDENGTTQKPEDLANLFTDIWEGDIYQYNIFDNLEDDIVDTYYIYGRCTSYEEEKAIKKEIKEKYNIDTEDYF